MNELILLIEGACLGALLMLLVQVLFAVRDDRRSDLTQD